jgi:hypothetical protein
MAWIDVTKNERNEIESARDQYLFALEQLAKRYDLSGDVDELLAYGESVACEGYLEDGTI